MKRRIPHSGPQPGYCHIKLLLVIDTDFPNDQVGKNILQQNTRQVGIKKSKREKTRQKNIGYKLQS